jgi:hypothetical protein
MNNIQKRFLLFIFGCIGSRSLLVYISANANAYYLKWLGVLALLPAIGFALIYIGGLRSSGAEVFGAPIWWNSLRPIHSILYFAFAYNAINGNKNSWKYLLVDVLLGFSAFITFHYFNGSFPKLL